jgi:hypothetical protein
MISKNHIYHEVRLMGSVDRTSFEVPDFLMVLILHLCKFISVARLTLMMILVSSSMSAQAAAGWLDPQWSNREIVTVTNSGGAVLSNFQVHVTLDGAFDFTQAKSDGSDIRFTSDDGVTLVPFWMEAWDPGNKKASFWLKVPTVQTAGTTLYMYHGNSAATSVSNGNATFEFFDDFDAGGGLPTLGYYNLGAPQTELVQDQPWETAAPHTMSVVQNNSGGFTYWGYYGLQDCGGVGLALSNDLVTWTKQASPLFLNGRWPSVLKVGNTFYMLYTKDYCANSYIVLAESSDGINFTDVKTIVSPQSGLRNQNPKLFHDPNDGKYYIYWYNGNDINNFYIRARSAPTIESLDNPTSEAVVLQSIFVLAAPDMMFRDGTYFLSTESRDVNGHWDTLVYASTAPTNGFVLLPDNPILADGSACMFQQIFATNLQEYYCKQDSGTGIWTLEHRVADLTKGRSLVQVQQGVLDLNKWIATGGTWQVATSTQQDGTPGGVLQGTIGTSGQQILRSKYYSGSDYVLEVYGKQLSGRVWGVGVRAFDQFDLFDINLYEDLDATNNLYVYNWVSGSSTTQLNSTAVGTVSTNTWYKLAVKVHGNAIDVYKDGILKLQTSSSQYAFGAIGLYGEGNTIAQFNNVLLRKYASVEPTATVLLGAPVMVSSLQLNPGTLVGGGTSQGTVVLSGPAPTGGAVVSLSSSNPFVANVPSTVAVLSGATNATFTVTTNPTLSTSFLNITASYGPGTQTAVLTVNPVPVGGSVAFVQAAGNFGESVPYTVSMAPTAGNFLAVFVWQIEWAAAPTAMTDNRGSVYTKDCDLTFNQGAGVRRLTVYHLPNVPSGITGINITPNKPSRAIVAEYSGMPTGGALLDVCGAVNNQTTASATWSSAATATTATDLVFGLTDTGYSGNAGFGASGVWTGRIAQHDSVDADDSYFEDQINVAPGSYTATGTSSVSLAKSSVVVAFKTTSGPAALASVTLNPASVVGGSPSTGTVTLNAPAPSGGAVVTLSSSNPSATVPSNVTVAANATTATFTVTTSAVSAVTPVTITGTYNGTWTVTLTVNPPAAVALSSVSVSPTAVIGGVSSTGTVALTGAAPTGGIVVTLSDNNASASEPTSVTVPPGAPSATFTIATTPVVSNTMVTISAALNNTTKTTTLTVNRPTLSTLTVNPTSVKGGTSSTGTVALTGVAPTGGSVVTLLDNNSAAAEPSSVTVPAGATTATFTITTATVTSTRNVTISGRFNGTTKTATLSITP